MFQLIFIYQSASKGKVPGGVVVRRFLKTRRSILGSVCPIKRLCLWECWVTDRHCDSLSSWRSQKCPVSQQLITMRHLPLTFSWCPFSNPPCPGCCQFWESYWLLQYTRCEATVCRLYSWPIVVQKSITAIHTFTLNQHHFRNTKQ